MIKILLTGYNGAMGETVLNNLPQDMKVVSGISQHLDQRDFETNTNLSDVKEAFDVILDFSHVSFLDEVLDFAQANKKPLVIASTGITEKLHNKIDAYAKEIPIVQAGNYSLGVYALNEAIRKVHHILDDYDVEILEKHHRYKKDAPSGTAEMMFETLQESNDALYLTYGRQGQSDAKDKNEVGMHSLRSGTIVGEHSILFAGEDEVLEIKHTASSKTIFAMGAFKALRYVLNKDKGRYTLKDVVENA
ncbi:MAG TPA: 4-hydroxy-tetrahydrodipicolinate reductase [Erysipelothrix sp.]|nr:4-hydroxy-tetrahydrodipicolinate reductase [Erysipelothrix sp.]